MKKIILITTFLSFFSSFSQTKKDTIIVVEKEIVFKTDTLYNTIIKPVITKRSINRSTNKPLHGFYKIITGKETYFIMRYKAGIEDNLVINSVKYYNKERLHQLKITGIQIFGQNYIFIPNYDCDKKKLTGFYVPIMNEEIRKPIQIKQKFRKKYVLWKVTFKNSIVAHVRLNRDEFSDCYE